MGLTFPVVSLSLVSLDPPHTLPPKANNLLEDTVYTIYLENSKLVRIRAERLYSFYVLP